MAVTETERDAEAEEVDALVDRLLAEHDPATTPAEDFLGAQFDLGLAWVSFPPGSGGLGKSPRLQERVNARLREAGAPWAAVRNPIGFGMAAPTIVAYGTEAQRQRWLRPLFTGEEVWCQLFSEPGAGSDVAGLATRAVADGEEWVVNGQKVWTTLAHVATWGLLLARSDPDVPKHRGLTYFALDMRSEGVEVRPLRQMTGEAEFNEVYLTDVRVSDADRLGDVGAGWSVAITTLMNERVSIGGVVTPRGSGPIAEAVELWRARHRDDPVAAERVCQLWIRSEALRLTNVRAANARRKGTPGPEGSVGKLSAAELNKAIYNCCVDLLGAEGTLYESYDMVRPDRAGTGGKDLRKAFLRSRANSIEGGTSEIMRNILAERVLGLPGDVRVDKDVPWSAVPRG
jgi:alkylation response protein AidB-like acyl-CoA dehydrogenase